MKYEVEIEGLQVTAVIEKRGEEISADIDGRRYELKIVSPERGVYTIFDSDRVYEARVWPGDQNLLRVKIGGNLFSTIVIDRKHRRPTTEHRTEGRQNLTAPMPGKVVRVLLSVGENVAAGQGVLVVEAMKMQNEIRSPKSGRVIEVRVSEGDNVNANQVLAMVD
ncbi:MAG TPA: biotin/lipoyl-containing protein [Blastocatellia bacterium]|nr:biotin/lipoyl-containing protein [Blastocatellia bacterium]